MGRASLVAASVLLVALVAAGAASAQAFLFPSEVELRVERGQVGTASFTAQNAVNQSLAGFARVQGGLAGSTVLPDGFTLHRGGSQGFEVQVPTKGLGLGVHEGLLRVVVVNQDTGAIQTLLANVTVRVTQPPLVFGTWPSPLPEPLDQAAGVFLVEFAAWTAAALVLIRANDVFFKRAMTRAPAWLKDRVMGRVDKPLLLLAVVGGVKSAWRVFPDEGLYRITDGVLAAAVVLAVALALYRIADAALTYYGQAIAARTPTKVDDVLVPILRKLAVVVVIGFAFVYGFQSLGVDLGFLVAGGLVVGLVVSMAAQPTLSNLFAGIFIMLDRPFLEGDDIRLDQGEVCRVVSIGLRSTRLYGYAHHEIVVVPNNELASKPVVNLMHPDSQYRLHVKVAVAADADVERVRRVLLETATAQSGVVKEGDKAPLVLLDDFTDAGLLFHLMFVVSFVRDRGTVASDVRFAIVEAFRREGIEIALPQRVLVTRPAA